MNPSLPPPYVYRQHFDAELLQSWHVAAKSEVGRLSVSALRGSERAPWIGGCSLSGIAQALGGPDNYVLAQVEFDHVLFVRRDVAPRVLPFWSEMSNLTLRDHWLAGYYCHPARHAKRMDFEQARFDFRTLVNPHEALARGLSGGHPKSGPEVEKSVRRLLRRTGGLELRKEDLDARNPKVERVPFTLERCETCG